MNRSVIDADLQQIIAHTRELWEDLRGGRLFVTGGTGFFGKWLLESFVRANDELSLDAKAVVLTRDPETFSRDYPKLAADPALSFLCGDIRDFAFPDAEFSHVIHAATQASVALNESAPLEMFDTIAEGTRRTLDFAASRGARKFLLTSSGAVYGRQPVDLSHLPEDYAGAPDPLDPKSAYGEGKRAAELLCALYSRQCGIETKIARCFAFAGPYLPLDGAFAIGNFIRDAMNGGPIAVQGDGTPYRSYLYASDLAVWLWTIFFKGTPGRAYNVGSESSVSVLELARVVANAADLSERVSVAGTPAHGAPAERYVPSVRRASSELGLEQSVGLDEAIRRTLCFYSGALLRSEPEGNRQ